MKKRQLILNNKKGSALLYVLILMLVGIVLVGAVLTASVSFTTKASNENQEGQAYYTAKSVCDTIAYELMSDETGELGLQVLAILKVPEQKLPVSSIVLPDTEMGDIDEAYIQYIEEDLYVITVTASKNDKSSTVTLKLRMKRDYKDASAEMFPGLDIHLKEPQFMELLGDKSSLLVRNIPELDSGTTKAKQDRITVGGGMVIMNESSTGTSSQTPHTQLYSSWKIGGSLYTSDGTLTLLKDQVPPSTTSGSPIVQLSTVTLVGTEYKAIEGENDYKLTASTYNGLKKTTDRMNELYLNMEKPQWANYYSAAKLPTTGNLVSGAYYEVDRYTLIEDINEKISGVDPEDLAVIVIKEGQTLIVAGYTLNMEEIDGEPTSPKLLFYIEEGGKLYLPGESNLGAYGEKDSTIEISGWAPKVKGQIKVDNFEYNMGTTSLKFTYNPIVISEYYEEGSVPTWTLDGYIGGYYKE